VPKIIKIEREYDKVIEIKRVQFLPHPVFAVNKNWTSSNSRTAVESRRMGIGAKSKSNHYYNYSLRVFFFGVLFVLPSISISIYSFNNTVDTSQHDYKDKTND